MPNLERTLTHDVVMSYGIPGHHYVLHARAYECLDDRAPIVIMGEFGDHIGPSLINSVGEAAAAVQAALYPDGRHVRFVDLRNSWENRTDPVEFCEVEFARRKRRGRLARWLDRKMNERSNRSLFTVTVVDPHGVTRHVLPAVAHVDRIWDFSLASFLGDEPLEWPEEERSAMRPDGFYAELIRPANVRVPELLGDQLVQVWPKGLYTPALIGGPEAGKLADERRLACDQNYEATAGVIDALTSPRPDSFRDVGGTPNPDP